MDAIIRKHSAEAEGRDTHQTTQPQPQNQTVINSPRKQVWETKPMVLGPQKPRVPVAYMEQTHKHSNIPELLHKQYHQRVET